MSSQLEIETVLQQSLELDSQKSALCDHAASLLNEPADIFLKFLLDDNEGFAEHGSTLSSADVEGVA